MRLRLLVATLMILTSCGRGSAKDVITADRLASVATSTSLKSRDFTWSLTMLGHTVSVKGSLQDDYRYQAKVFMDSRPVYEEVVVDDARYLHVSDPSVLMDAATFAAVDPALSAATSGWVVDPLGAPAEFSLKRTERTPLDATYVLDRVRFLETLPVTLKQSFREYNTDAVTYLPKDDKFPAHKGDGTRFDHFPGPYDPNAITVTFESLKPYFEYISVWGTLGSITRVEYLMELPDPSAAQYREAYRQIRRAGSRSLNAILASGSSGRKFTQSFTSRLNPDVEIVPPQNATAVDLKAASAALTKALQANAPEAMFGPLVGLPG